MVRNAKEDLLRTRVRGISRFYKEKGRMPSFSEIGELAGLRSKNAVSKLINKLERLKVLERDDKGRLIPVSIASPVRLLGTVEAGFPSPAEESLADTLSLDDLLIQIMTSEQQFWDLIDQRLRPGADKEALDARTWDLFGEEWAVMFTDLSGFSRQVATFGIIHFLQVIFEQKRLLLPIVAANDGILIKVEADSFLIVFRRAAKAITCAVEIQRACQMLNQRRLPEEQILLFAWASGTVTSCASAMWTCSARR